MAGTDDEIRVYGERRLAWAVEHGFDAKAKAQWALFLASSPCSLIRESRWTRVAELAVFAPLSSDAWIDGVIDLALQDPKSGEVWIVDWKTNRIHAGEGHEALLDRLVGEYQAQLAAYGACALTVFPSSSVRVFLFSTGIGDWREIKWI